MATMVVVVLGPIVVEAQSQGARRADGQGRRGQMTHHNRGGRMAFGPGLLLRRSEALELNESQIAELTGLRDGLEAAGREANTGRADHRDRMYELLSADTPNLNEIREEFARTHATMSQFQWAQIEAGVNAKNLLTDEQRGIVQGWGQGRGGSGQMRGGNRANGRRGGAGMRGARGSQGFRRRF